MNKLPMYEPLSRDEVESINTTALRVLEEVGIGVMHEEARKLYRGAGARVEGERVYLPVDLVLREIDRAPRRVVLCGRNPDHDLNLEGTNVYAGTGGAALDVIDLNTRRARPTVLSDVADIALLVENLDNIHFFIRPCEPRDLPRSIVDVNKYYAALSNTTKHVMGSVHGVHGLQQSLELAWTIAGGRDEYLERPFLSFICCWMVSPLMLNTGTTELLLDVVREGAPVVLSTAPMAGSTSPLTLAGTLVQLHAELLSGIVLAQIANPGCPVIYGAVPSLANLMNGHYQGGSIEFGMLNAAITQVAHSWGLPLYNSAGLTDSKDADIQAGYEKAFSVLQAVLCGSNFIHHAAGMLEAMRTISYAQYVIDDEIVGMALRACKGIEVNERTLAFDCIKRIGPGGNYLMDDLTIESLRTEMFTRSIGDLRTREQWQEAGGPNLAETARLRAMEILGTARRPGLSPDVDSRIRRRFDIRLEYVDEEIPISDVLSKELV